MEHEDVAQTGRDCSDSLEQQVPVIAGRQRRPEEARRRMLQELKPARQLKRKAR